MIKTCDDCQKDFDIFEEGYGHEFFVVCGICWLTQLENQKKGGLISRVAH